MTPARILEALKAVGLLPGAEPYRGELVAAARMVASQILANDSLAKAKQAIENKYVKVEDGCSSNESVDAR